jgi:hypothetical protein
MNMIGIQMNSKARYKLTTARMSKFQAVRSEFIFWSSETPTALDRLLTRWMQLTHC